MGRKIGIEVEHTVETAKGIIPAGDRYGWNKDKPLMVAGLGTIHEDGAMMEIAIDPSETAEEQFSFYEQLVKITDKRLLKKGESLGLVSSAEYGTRDLLLSPSSMAIGCSPSFSAYHPKVNNTPSQYFDDFRYAGLHVNIDFDGTEAEKIAFVKTLDFHLGLHSVAHWEENSEMNAKRRTSYGRAGNFRFTPFGVEYRTLPADAWSEKNCKFIYSQVDKALANPFEHRNEDYRKIINNSNTDEAKKVLYG